MSIQLISEKEWPQIFEIQVQAYSTIEPESLEILQDKWLHSPESCFVYKQGEQVMGYLLAHSWNSETAPKLSKLLPKGSQGNILFLHDLALSKQALGKGIAPKMIEHLVKVAEQSGYGQIRLVSIQNSQQFWQKQGFEPVSYDVCKSYGQNAQAMKRVLQVR